MPAKFVNLIQFFEFKIFSELEMVHFIGGGLNCNAVVPGIYAIDMAPDEEFLLRQIGNTDAGMVNGQVFFGEKLPFKIEEIEISCAEQDMQGSEEPGSFQQQGNADAEEKKEFHQPEKEVHPGHGFQDIGPGHYQDQNVHGDQQETTEIEIIGLMGECMRNGMQQYKAGSRKVKEFAGALQFLEIRMHYRKSKGIHTVQFGVRCDKRIIPQKGVRIFLVVAGNKD
jgi:hypothetical protein